MKFFREIGIASTLILSTLTISGCFEKTDEQTKENVQPTQQPLTHKETVQAPVKSTQNSDGSSTYISSVNICSRDVPKEANTQSCGWGGSSIAFYAQGENFVSLDDKSLVIETLNIDGVDRLKNRKQEDNFSMGAFPKASDDGKYLKWELNITDGYHNLQNKLKVKGHLNAYTSQKLLEATSPEFDLKDFASFSLGPIQIKGTKAPEQDVRDFFANDDSLKEEDLALFEKIVEQSKTLGDNTPEKDAKKLLKDMGISESRIQALMGKLVSYMFKEAFSSLGSANSSDTVGISVTTTSSSVDRIELYSNDKKLEGSGWWGSEDSKTYSFSKPGSNKVYVKVFYWDKPSLVKINFDF